MIRLNQLFIASGLSLMIHGFFIYQFEESKKVEEIYVVDLSSHKEFKPKEIPKKKTKKVKIHKIITMIFVFFHIRSRKKLNYKR